MRLKTEYSKKRLNLQNSFLLYKPIPISHLFINTGVIFQFPSTMSIVVDDDINSLFHIWQKPDDYIKVKMKYFEGGIYEKSHYKKA